MKRLTQFIRANKAMQSLVLLSLFPSMVFLPSNLQANPTGGIVTGGAAEIGLGAGGHLQINQTSSRAVIDWASFSIAAGELTQFIQPGADAAVLNRVTSGTPTAIMGALQANGNVAVINTAGILVGPSGTIDVNGLLLSTLDVNNADFMGGGDMLFRGAGSAGVTNMGRINAVGGDVFLIGKTVVNTGAITAANGTVGLAAGEEVLITAAPDAAGERIFVRPTAGVASGTGVDNSGSIEGAMVELKAHGNMYALAINNSGSIRATGASMRGGKVTLRAIGGTITNSGSITATLPDGTGGRIILDGGVGGTVNAGGTIDASATGNGKIGGVVMISGESVTVPSGANIKANGEGGGGFVQIGSGDGVDAQNVAVQAGSSISANGGSGPGGMVVIQGGTDSNVMVAGAVSATSQSGDGGIIIVEGGDVTVTQTSTLDASGANGGVITVTGENSAVVNGNLNAVGSAGNGGVINISGGNSTTVGSTANINAGGSVNGGMVTITGGGTTSIAGNVSSVGGSGQGGQIQALGVAIEMEASARVDASGLAGGGQVNIGGGFQGKNPEIINATITTLASGAQIKADATGDGDGGVVVVWADGDTLYEGSISARGAGVGNGGFVEVSGKESLLFEGIVDTMADDGTAGTLLLDPANITIGAAVQTALGSSNVWVVTGNSGPGNGDIITNANIRWNNANSLSLLAWGDVDINYDIQNAGQGSVNIVAGWDGSTGLVPPAVAGSGQINMAQPVDMSSFFGSSGTYGQRNGSVLIGAQRGVAVGSRYGDTNIVGYDINLQTGTSGNDWAQIGFRDDGFTNSTTSTQWWVGATNGTGTGTDAAGNGATGNLTLEVHNEVRGEINGGAYSYVQIGHGGANLRYQNAAGNGSNGGDMSGNITITTGVDGLGTGNVTISGAGSDNYRAYVQVGHGGWRNRGDHSGDITIDTTAGTVGDVSFESGDEYRNYSMLGNGGMEFSSDGYGGGYDMSGNINVQAGGQVTFLAALGTGVAYNSWRDAERAFTQLGNGGFDVDGSHSGNITVNAGSDITFQSGDMRYAYAQLGNGGWGSGENNGGTNGGGAGDHSGAITVSSGGNILFDARGRGTTPPVKYRNIAYVQLGHGGYAAKGDHSGAINVTATGGIEFYAADGSVSAGLLRADTGYAQLGHGGYDADNSSNANDSPGNSGDITVQAGADIIFKAGGGRNTSVQLGHGGYGNRGAHTGDIIVRTTGGKIQFTSGIGAADGDYQSFSQLGHGGYDADGNHSGDITVISTQDLAGLGVVFKAGDRRDNYTQLGHGGRSARSGTAANPFGLNGDITVSTVGDIQFLAGTMTEDVASDEDGRLYALLGHGGYDADPSGNNDDNRGVAGWGHFGDIAVNTTMGDILFRGGVSSTLDPVLGIGGGGGRFAFAQLGHGGTFTNGDFYGAIDVRAGYDSMGNLTNVASDLTFEAGGDTDDNSSEYAYAQLGHGGGGYGTWGGTNFGGGNASSTGVVVAAGNAVNVLGGTSGAVNHAQIGLGGRDRVGNFTSPITVIAGAGGVNLLGGTGSTNFSQIGNAGYNADGDHAGMISVTSGGKIDLAGGAGSAAYAMIGHGDQSSASGTRQGDIYVRAAGEISLDPATGIVSIGHRTSSGVSQISNANVTIEAASMDEIVGDAFSNIFTVSSLIGNMMQDNLAGGDVSLYATGTGGLWMNSTGNILYETATDFNLLSQYDVYFTDDVMNRGAGAINVVAGWDPTTAPLASPTGIIAGIDMDADIFSVAGAYGNNTGDVFVGIAADGLGTDTGAGADTNLALASRLGETNVAGRDVNVWSSPLTAVGADAGGRRFAMIGYNRRYSGNSGLLDASGAIRVEATNDVNITANKFAVGSEGYGANGGGWNDSPTNPNGGNQGFGAFAKIGHGGREALRTSQLSGDITVVAGRDVMARGGKTRENFVMIGHGGYDNKQDLNTATATIGAAEIIVTAGRDVDFRAGLGNGAYAQIGSGGYNQVLNSFTASDITVTAGGDVLFYGGAGGVGGTQNNSIAYAQLGHGGYDSDLTNSAIAGGQGFAGNITVNAGGAIEFRGGDAGSNYAQLGNGGNYTNGNQAGNITVVSAGDIDFMGGAGGQAGAQIGNGGFRANANTITGNISVTANGTGGLTFTAGSGAQAMAQIGHGGYEADGNLSGNITVAGGTGGINFTASTLGYFAQAQIGHGGRDSGLGGPGDKAGNITVTSAGGGITFAAGGINASGRYANAQIGHGGYGNAVTGNYSGDISVTANGGGDISFSGGGSYGNYVMLGHGGFGAGTGIDGDMTGNIAVTADGDVSFTGGSERYTFAMLGHGGRDNDGTKGGAGATIDVTSNTGSVNFSGGTGTERAYAQLGNGGEDSQGNSEVAITVNALSGGVVFTGGTGTYNYAQLGSGGRNADGNIIGNIVVNAGAGGIDFSAGSGGTAYVQIGNGGRDTGGVLGGNITITSVGTIDFDGGLGSSGSYAQIGHGGLYASGNQTGDISVISSAGAILFTAGSATQTSAKIGHGGDEAGGDKSGLITVDAQGGNVEFRAGSGDRAYVQLGHGSTNASGVVTGGIDVDASGDVIFATGSGGAGNWKYAQLGHGGYNNDGDKSGVIDVNAGGAITFSSAGVSGSYGFTQLGHGGAQSGGNFSGAIGVQAVNAINFVGGGANQAYSQLGNGGYNADGNIVGAISVSTTNTITLQSGSADDTYTMIGNGGYNSAGSHSGAVQVLATGDVVVTAGGGARAFSQIGNGGYDADGTQAGDVSVASTSGGVSLTAGNGTYAQIGNGGARNSGTRSGNVTVRAAQDVVVQGGQAGESFAAIGHGALSGGGSASGEVRVSAGSGSLDGTGTGAGSGMGIFSDIGTFGALTFAATNAGAGKVQLFGGQAGSADSWAVIGHIGRDAGGTKTGLIDVMAVDDIDLIAGAGQRASAQIGHGGRSSGGTNTGDITLTSLNGDLTLSGGNGGSSESFAQVGHGGGASYDTGGSNGVKTGDITVDVGGAVDLNGGLGGANSNYAQIGHGGRGAGNAATDTKTGDILVKAVTGISADGGAGVNNYAQIGHGGFNATGDNSGSIRLVATTGGISFSGGTGSQAYAQLGHGGAGSVGTNSGNIIARSGGDFLITPGTGAGAYAQVGHGGTNAGAAAGHTGSITMSAGTFDPDLQFNGVVGSRYYTDVDATITDATTLGVRVGVASPGDAAGSGAYAQIGHGGYNAAGAHGAGDPVANGILVESTGALAVNGGGASGNYAQIGHGGYNANGNLAGRIKIGVGNGITVAGGSANQAYAQIGLGGMDNDGTKNGMLEVFSRMGDIAVTGGTVAGAYGQIGHGGLNADGNIDHEGLGLYVQSGWDTTNATPAPAGADLTVTSNAGYGMIGSGDGVPSGTGDRNGVFFTNATGNTTINGVMGHRTASGTITSPGYLIQSAGNINIGSPGTISGAAASNLAGNGLQLAAGGFININEAVNFSSAVDSTFAAVRSINVNASVQNAGSGNLNLVAGWDGSTGLTAATPFIYDNVPPATPGSLAFAPIEADTAAWGNAGGSVVIGDGTQASGIAVGSRDGQTNVLGYGLALNAGAAGNSFAQLGYRTSGGDLSASGDIIVKLKESATLNAGTGTGASAQIGHGATYLAGGGNLSGDITVTTDGTVAGNVALNGGTGLDSSAQIGHGGVQNTADKSGAILVQTADGDIALTSGAGDKAYSQIGHGGVNAAASSTGAAGELIEVIASNDVALAASASGLRAYSQIGNGGFNADITTTAGNVRVLAGNQIGITAGAAQQAYAQIGHGGGAADGDKSGTIIVHAGDNAMAGDVNLTRGAGDDAYAKIGHGDQAFTNGAAGSGSGNIDGGIQVTAGENITSVGGMIGHVDSSTGSSAVATSGSTFIQVSANDVPGNTVATGDGVMTADANSVFSSAVSGELRFYFPSRANNQIAAGTLFNGNAFGGAMVDPALQGSDEFLVSLNQHTYLNTAVANAVGLSLNLDPIDAANYAAALGYGLYYADANLVVPPVVPPSGGDSGATMPTAPVVPPIFVIIGGQLNFNQGVFGLGSPFVPVGPFVGGFTNDYFNSDIQRNRLELFDAGDKNGWTDSSGPWVSSFDTIFSTVEEGEGWSSFGVFGDGRHQSGGYGRAFDGINQAPEMGDELRRLLENLEAELAELRGGE